MFYDEKEEKVENLKRIERYFIKSGCGCNFMGCD